MRPSCNACGMTMVPLTSEVDCCPRCDTAAQGQSMRVGPPSMPNTNNGWFHAPFGDLK